MADPVISRAMIEAKARSAFARGAGREDHGFNWHAHAIAVWQEEWDRCERDRLLDEVVDIADACPNEPAAIEDARQRIAANIHAAGVSYGVRP
ncbi:hypothetical protein IP91_00101 [Pseudoduganella lurida]|uniref:Uncharacterized protein n=1 Tax=Pseudoduganella lurida TaxID=1036180 RepID=A0A562RKS9_9BURK|nr:hypothetical protein [Pseudoduganella lurida]TWI69036.1 hypothetical protein IP91_00101 [Pseudoduganella lurida]